MSYRIEIDEVRSACRGRWKAVLGNVGMQDAFINGKHGPCPFCGGKDRWRFYENKNEGAGDGYCNQCDAKGDGLWIATKYLREIRGYSFPESLEMIAAAGGGHHAR